MFERAPTEYGPDFVQWAWTASKVQYTYFCWRLTAESVAAGVSIAKGEKAATTRVNWRRFAFLFPAGPKPDRGAISKLDWATNSGNYPKGAQQIDRVVERAIKQIKTKSKAAKKEH